MIPRRRQAATSITSWPVAATAIIFSSGSSASAASPMGTLLVIAIVAPARRAAT